VQTFFFFWENFEGAGVRRERNAQVLIIPCLLLGAIPLANRREVASLPKHEAICNFSRFGRIQCVHLNCNGLLAHIIKAAIRYVLYTILKKVAAKV